MAELITDALRRRLRSSGSAPLITYYDLGTGERTELSAITFANWVDKTANLLIEEIGAEAGDLIGLPLARAAPGHWLTFVWEMACWQTRTAVVLTDPSSQIAVVSGPDWEPWLGRQVYACSLQPLGFGFPEPLPAGVHDYAVEVRGQPDTFAGMSPRPEVVAWVDADRTLTQADLVATAAASRRRLVRPSDPWTTCRDALLATVASGGSAVVVVGPADEAQLRHVATSEQVED